MTPGARVAAAIEVLDRITAGAAAEQALTSWARGSRFAGSKDRAAVRDHVFDVLRRRASLAVMAGNDTGRGMMIALARSADLDVDMLFTGEGHAPEVLNDGERAPLADVRQIYDQCDVPAWLWPQWRDSLQDQAFAAGSTQQERASLYLRVNPRKATVAEAQTSLAAEDIPTTPTEALGSALEVLGNIRRVKLSKAFLSGEVEIQDVASQLAMARLEIPEGARVLDYCAGGGGKGLALAANHNCSVIAHDISVARMVDIPARALRAGVAIKTTDTAGLQSAELFDVVICDAPCSGSGTWRRTPAAKWLLTQDKLNEYNKMQREVLSESLGRVRSGGIVAYMTCSVLDCENRKIVQEVLDATGQIQEIDRMTLTPSAASDGFFLSVLHKA